MAKRPTKTRRHLPVHLRRAVTGEQEADQVGALLQQHADRKLDDWQAAPQLRALAAASGGRLIDDLVNRLGSAEGPLRDSIIWAIGVIAGQESLLRLWQIARTPHKSRGARLAALSAIERLHGPVDPKDLPPDLVALQAEASRPSLTELMRQVGSAAQPAEVEDLLMPFLEALLYVERPGRAFANVIEEAVARRDRSGTAFLRALAALAPTPTARSEARIAAAGLAERGLVPTGAGVLDLRNEPSLVAYTATAPDNPAQLRILLGVRRVSDRLRLLNFLIETAGSASTVLDLEVTEDLTEAELRERYIQQSWLSGAPLRETSVEAATGIIRRGVEGALARPQNIPEAVVRYLPLIRRYALGD